MNIPNVITSQSTNQIHPSEIPRTTNFYVASSPDPPSPRVILDAIRAGVGLRLGPRLRRFPDETATHLVTPFPVSLMRITLLVAPFPADHSFSRSLGDTEDHIPGTSKNPLQALKIPQHMATTEHKRWSLTAMEWYVPQATQMLGW